MASAHKMGAAAIALGLVLAAAPAFAQAGAGQGAQGGNPTAPVPQYWVADASLFIGNAARAADTLAMEEAFNVPAPQILGDQAQFLLTATTRALQSIAELQRNAMATNPAAVPAIRAAAGQLVAARLQAMRVASAASSGVLGPAFGVSVRATMTHLLAAEQLMIGAGQAFGAETFATAGACSAATEQAP